MEKSLSLKAKRKQQEMKERDRKRKRKAMFDPEKRAKHYEAIKRYREKEKIRKAGHKGSIDLIRARNISEVL
jgi:hypothetical protein